ncbi:MAG TPA: hypothetical protein VF365_01790 [Candidatus Limnocylindria bacterium]
MANIASNRARWWIGGIVVIVAGVGGFLGVRLLAGDPPGGCAAGVSLSFVGELQGTETQADTASAGQVIEYSVQLILTNDQCPIQDGAVTIRLPDGITATAATALSMGRGETRTFRDAAAYVVDPVDASASAAPSGGPTASGPLRAMAEVTATIRRDDGSTDEVQAGTSFTTEVTQPAD